MIEKRSKKFSNIGFSHEILFLTIYKLLYSSSSYGLDNYTLKYTNLFLSQTLLNIMYETQRASVVVKMTLAASTKIAPTLFSFPVFGPIMCGAIAGCGGAFLPMNKGLDPIATGLQPPMMTALIGATCFHLYVNTSLSDGCIDAKMKAKVFVALFFIMIGLINALDLKAKPQVKKEGSKAKKE